MNIGREYIETRGSLASLGPTRRFVGDSISLYVVLRVDHAQFGILTGVSMAYPTLCSPRSGPRTI